MCMQIYGYVHIHQADEDGDCGIHGFEFEDVIIHYMYVYANICIHTSGG